MRQVKLSTDTPTARLVICLAMSQVPGGSTASMTILVNIPPTAGSIETVAIATHPVVVAQGKVIAMETIVTIAAFLWTLFLPTVV